tara:strand:- start:9 stop:584 length:576 start_codon:yes stop_codon:yes gene_type:complete
MKILLTLLVLFFSSSTFADDISDFQIEGMSVGDSLLDYFSEDEIKNNIYDAYPNKEDSTFTTVEISTLKSFKNYDAIQAMVKENDNKYIAYTMDGMISYRNNIEECYSKQNEIVEELSIIFNNVTINDPGVFKSKQDITGKSTHKGIYFDFPSGNYVEVVCYDWSKEIGWIDHLRIGITSKEVSDWISANN